jgi:hypothetical protein
MYSLIMVHEMDLRDGRFVRPEMLGVEVVLDGWQRLNLADADMEARGIALFEGLYAAYSSRSSEESDARIGH